MRCAAIRDAFFESHAGNGLVTPLASTCRGMHCVLVSNQTDSNIWMATLDSEE
jgi:hypothetical protein